LTENLITIGRTPENSLCIQDTNVSRRHGILVRDGDNYQLHDFKSANGTFVNGEKKQDAPVTDMLFGVSDIIAYISAFMTLEPGDLIATGTPPGVGPLQPGSIVKVVIEGVGVLENPVIAQE